MKVLNHNREIAKDAVETVKSGKKAVVGVYEVEFDDIGKISIELVAEGGKVHLEGRAEQKPRDEKESMKIDAVISVLKERVAKHIIWFTLDLWRYLENPA
jgi:hypothetical protein